METRKNFYNGEQEEPRDLDIEKLMYEIPGNDESNIDRYLRAKKRGERELERITLKSRFVECPTSDDKYELLRDAITSSDIQLQKTGIELVSYLENDRQNELQYLVDQNVKNGLLSEEPEKRRVAASMVRCVSESNIDVMIEHVKSSIEEYIKNNDSSVQKVGAQMIALLPDFNDRLKYETLLFEYVENQLLSNDFQGTVNVTELMRYISSDVLPGLITKVLDGNNTEAQILAVQYIKRLDPRVAISVLRQVFNTKDLYLKKVAAEAVTRLFRIHNKQPDIPVDISDAITKTTNEALASDESEIQKNGAEMLKDVSDINELPKLIEVGMNSNDEQVRIIAIKALKYMRPDIKSSKDSMRDFVLEALGSGNIDMQKAAITVARHVPEPGKNECMNEAFLLISGLIKSEDNEEQKNGAEMAYYVTHPNMEELFSIIEKDSELLNTLMFSRLYPDDQNGLDKDNAASFHRRIKFAKTGSEMTLLRGGTLEGKLLIRHIKKSAFLGWMLAFENYEAWLAEDFDYVPVEPIQSFAFKKNTIDVYAGLFDIDLKHWLTVSGGRFKQELLVMRKKIIFVLQKMDIRHGDLHTGNFFLKFSRHTDGSIDTQTCPRVYVGDFDKSMVKINLKHNK
ncbi:MAG: HEAT repeat domain-containing protein [Candidatus Magasanikbacteria bacterium]|jgi:hypothetical protein|nr:HEAT repeat domain-containing protein [Candidatus Magasanikbacteria bacterium]MBT4071985.1 HEAT repeat domain-containing protein [Candidatus Magasanikbacteria bacterium]